MARMAPDTREADIAAIREGDLAWVKAQETHGKAAADMYSSDDFGIAAFRLERGII